MGCFNFTGCFSKCVIEYTDRVVLIILRENTTGEYIPAALPIRGKYDDYGWIDDIEDSENLKYILQSLGIDSVNKLQNELESREGFTYVMELEEYYDTVVKQRKTTIGNSTSLYKHYELMTKLGFIQFDNRRPQVFKHPLCWDVEVSVGYSFKVDNYRVDSLGEVIEYLNKKRSINIDMPEWLNDSIYYALIEPLGDIYSALQCLTGKNTDYMSCDSSRLNFLRFSFGSAEEMLEKAEKYNAPVENKEEFIRCANVLLDTITKRDVPYLFIDVFKCFFQYNCGPLLSLNSSFNFYKHPQYIEELFKFTDFSSFLCDVHMDYCTTSSSAGQSVNAKAMVTHVYAQTLCLKRYFDKLIESDNDKRFIGIDKAVSGLQSLLEIKNLDTCE